MDGCDWQLIRMNSSHVEILQKLADVMSASDVGGVAPTQHTLVDIVSLVGKVVYNSLSEYCT